MDSTGQRFDKRSMMYGNRFGDFVIERSHREFHVFRHCAKRCLSEAVNIVLILAHPILPSLAETAFPARHNLLGDCHIAERETIFFARAFAQRQYFTDKFVTGDYRWLAVAR